MNKSIRVLHFHKTSLPQSIGGIESFIDTLCRASSKYNIRNTVLSLAKEPSKTPINMESYEVHQAKQLFELASAGFSISAIKKFKQLADNADIIHYHFPNPFADILHFICKIDKPTVLTYHSDIIKQRYLLKLYTPLMYNFLNSVDHIVSTSPNYFATSDNLKHHTKKVTIIPIGINTAAYPKLNEERIKYWNTRLPKPFFLFIGAMRYYKGLHVALDAISGTDIQLAIAGIGGIEADLKHQAQKNRLENVDFLGMISDEDKIALLSLCYGFIFPSHLRSEAFGISLLEAAAYGKPLISCEIGTGTSFVNQHDVTGLVIEPSSSKALKNAMQYLLDNPEKASEFGNNARIRSQTLFTAENQAHSYYKIYKELLNKDIH